MEVEYAIYIRNRKTASSPLRANEALIVLDESTMRYILHSPFRLAWQVKEMSHRRWSLAKRGVDYHPPRQNHGRIGKLSDQMRFNKPRKSVPMTMTTSTVDEEDVAIPSSSC